MIYITGDTHNTVDMSNLSTCNMKLCCRVQNVEFPLYHQGIVI